MVNGPYGARVALYHAVICACVNSTLQMPNGPMPPSKKAAKEDWFVESPVERPVKAALYVVVFETPST